MGKAAQKRIQLSVCCICVFLAVTALFQTGLLSWLENKSYDSRIVSTADFFKPSDDISVVLLDQESLDWAKEELGWSWPWPRAAYASMIDYFNRGNAASVAFDMIYSEQSVYGAEDDKILGRSCRESGRVVQTIYYDSPDHPVLPVKEVADSAAVLANVTSDLDGDGVARRGIFYAETGEPGMPVASLSTGGLEDLDGLLKKIPQAKGGGMYIRFQKNLGSYIPYNAAQILKSEYEILAAEKEGREPDFDGDLLDPEQFEDSYIFFGLFAPGLFDICATPVSQNYPGVGVHICQMDTILQENFLRDTPLVLVLLIILASAAAGTLLGHNISFSKPGKFFANIAFFALLLALYIAGSYFLFYKGLILPFSPVLIAFAAAYIASSFLNYFTEGKQKLYLKSAFRQYLSPAIIDTLIEKPDMLKLGGERREITAYFSDIQGFTSISEGLTPEQLTLFLNTYLSAMTDIILSYGGTIDKYEGDAIIAFWNAPTNQEDHAARALKAALDCQKKLLSMQETLTAISGGKAVKQRIGLNTGFATVGNFGSDKRFDYTMMGDTVNLASRLEGINKMFGTYTMCSEATKKSALEHGSKLSFRNVSNIAVVGRKEAVRIYVPMEQDEADSNSAQFKAFEAAYAEFIAGRFEKTLPMFEANAEKDIVSRKYAEKCRDFIKTPPENWQGYLKATEK